MYMVWIIKAYINKQCWIFRLSDVVFVYVLQKGVLKIKFEYSKNIFKVNTTFLDIPKDLSLCYNWLKWNNFSHIFNICI